MSSEDPPQVRSRSACQQQDGMITPSIFYYFAFGSNMRIRQMSLRCPNSWYEGVGRLAGWRWQINERGVANIVEDLDSFVDGLVFSVSESDIRVLDRNEGVSRGFYKRESVSLLLARTARPMETWKLAPNLQEFCSANANIGIFDQLAIAYVSDMRGNGPIREEYIDRMRYAVDDAQNLGINRDYAERTIMPFLQRPILQPVDRPANNAGQELVTMTPATHPLAQTSQDQQSENETPTRSRSQHIERYKNDIEYANAYDAQREQKRRSRKAKTTPQEQSEHGAHGWKESG